MLDVTDCGWCFIQKNFIYLLRSAKNRKQSNLHIHFEIDAQRKTLSAHAGARKKNKKKEKKMCM